MRDFFSPFLNSGFVFPFPIDIPKTLDKTNAMQGILEELKNGPLKTIRSYRYHG